MVVVGLGVLLWMEHYKVARMQPAYTDLMRRHTSLVEQLEAQRIATYTDLRNGETTIIRDAKIMIQGGPKGPGQPIRPATPIRP